MLPLRLAAPGQRLSVLCLGAHSDDIEIGAGATLLHWKACGIRMEVHWCVLSAMGPREAEARTSAEELLQGTGTSIEIQAFRDGFFPAQCAEIKTWFENLKERVEPDLILTHSHVDQHQDHRQINTLTWNTFRDHLILEYEIPKWDGDLGRPNFYVPVSAMAIDRKAELLVRHFRTQRAKHWFDEETFRALARIRGIECRAPERYAEAFFVPKLVVL